jgi:hypothetical protein
VRRGYLFRCSASLAFANKLEGLLRRDAELIGVYCVYSAEASGLVVGASGSKPKRPTRYL